MHVNRSLTADIRRALQLAPVCAALFAPSLWAQGTAAPPAAPRSSPETAPAGNDIVELSPFEVSAEQNNGYEATNTMSGTRLNSRIEDLAASITVVTKQQLLDTAAVDVNDIFRTEANTEGIYQYTEFAIDRGFTVDTVAQNPSGANRIRGLGAANVSRDGFASTSAVPIDTYNIDGLEISRGPNSNIFGLGDSSGTVNLISSRANTSRATTHVEARIDSSGGVRGSVDFNRPIIQDKLGVRVSYLNEAKGFERKPSEELIHRLQGTFTFQPFSKTTIRGTYESYHNFNQRPNSVTPRDTITFWRANNMPVWNPVTYSWRYLNSSTYTQVTPAQETTLLPVGLVPQFNTLWARPSWYIDDGEVKLWMVNRLPAANTNFPNIASNSRLLANGTVLQNGGGTFVLPGNTTGTLFTPTPLYQQPGATDSSIYDWTSTNFASPNWGRDKADTYKLEFEQYFLNRDDQVLAFRTGFFGESVDSYSRNFVGASDGAPPYIQVDINEKLLDGRDNPYFLRPFVSASELQAYRRPQENDNYRADLAYRLDLTKRDGWLRFLGKHSLAGYGEFRSLINVPNGLRYRDQVVSNNSWMSAANLTNITGRGAEDHIFSRYYLGDKVATGAQVVDYGAPRLPTTTGTYPIYFFNGITNQWVTENADIGELEFSTQNLQKREIRTKGLVWQGFFWDDRIVPTLGVRKDQQRQRAADNDIVYPNNILRPSFTFDTKPWIYGAGTTRTQGVVVKPFSWLNLSYNQSDSFLPESTAYSVLGELLPNPTGKGKDYGFTVSTRDGKFVARVNKYHTQQKNSRNGSVAVLATRVFRLDFVYPTVITDSNLPLIATSNDAFNIQRAYYNYLALLRPTWTPTQIVDEIWKTYLGPGLDRDWVTTIQAGGLSFTDVNTVTSDGIELELNYNPNRYWTLKATGAKQKAVDTDLSPNVPQYVANRMAWWTTLKVPTETYIDPATGAVTSFANAGNPWWDTTYGSAGTPHNFYTGNIDAPYSLAVTNQGKPRPQTRQYRFNVTTSYKLAGLNDRNWMKDVTVGTTLRWEDKAVIGFLGATPDADGAVRHLDGNQPVYDKARYYADVMVAYNLKLSDKVRTRVQLNVYNVFENGRLQPVAVNPDGTPWNFRIIDPRQFILTTTFDL